MEKVYVFGHRNPDTDSVTAAITLANLKKKLGINAVPAVLSSINRETMYALKYFNVLEPMFINDIKLKVKDIDYSKNYMISEEKSIFAAYKKMEKEGISKIPVVDKNKKLIGVASMKDIASECLTGQYDNISSTYSNIVDVIKGNKVLKFNNVFKGKIIVPSFSSTTFVNDVKLRASDILITGNRDSIIEYAINSKINLIILTDGAFLKPNLMGLAIQNRINVISTNYKTLDVIKKISFSNSISSITNNTKIHIVNENENLSDFIVSTSKTKFTYYPIVNNDAECLGIIKLSSVGFHNKKKVILVDHNSYEQSAIGLDEALILEIVDHHNISNIGTTMPINFRNMPVGSTNTIVYLMYKENGVKITKQMAGMMLSGILSDTLILNSPTTTTIDKDAVNNLSRIAGVNYKEYGYNMISYGTQLDGKTKEEILYTDYKKYSTNDGLIGLGQIYTIDIKQIEDEKDEYISMLNRISSQNEYRFIALFVTDIIRNGTYIYYSDSAKEIFEKAFNMEMYEGIYIKGILSRKMQVLPSILSVMK